MTLRSTTIFIDNLPYGVNLWSISPTFYELRIIATKKFKPKMLVQKTFGSQSYQTFFFVKQRLFQFFAIKLGHFIKQTIFPYAKNTQA